jgi:glycosyltransferase involved in cell wall biosynthesis
VSEGRSAIRVANVCRVLWNGGVQRTSIAQTEGLRSLGYRVDLYFLRTVDQVAFSLPVGTIVCDSPPRSSWLSEIQRLITSWFASHRGTDATVDLDRLWALRATTREYSVVIYNDQWASLLGIWNAFVRKQPYVLMFHEFYPKVTTGLRSWMLNPLADLIDAVCILVAPAIVTESSSTKTKLDRIVSGRTRLARLGTPSLHAVPALADRDRRLIFSITVWDRGRHPELYLEVARLCPNFHIVLAGIWTDPQHLEQIRSLAAFVPNLSITGPVSEQDRMAWEAKALLYLRLGFAEAGPGVGGLEALSSGSVVICNRGLGLSEIISDGRNGFVLDRADPIEISRLLTRIDNMSTDELGRISQAAKDTARENSWQRHCQVLSEAIQTVVARRGPTTQRTADYLGSSAR